MVDLTETQKAILQAVGHQLVTGGPGSGKTTVSILKAAKIAREETDVWPVFTMPDWVRYQPVLQPIIDHVVQALKPGGVYVIADHAGRPLHPPGHQAAGFQERPCHGGNVRAQSQRLRDIDRWRATWADLLDQASEITCFSMSSAALLRRAFPHLDAQRIAVVPHEVDYLPAAGTWAAPLDGPLHIGVVGEISVQKGAAVVEQLAAIDPDSLTPREALDALYALKGLLR